MIEMEDRGKRDPDSATRYAAVSEALDRQPGKVDTRAAQRVLSTHEGLVCSHHDDIQLGTLWSVTATLKRPRLYRAEGQPCKTGYQLDKRLSTVTSSRRP